MTVRARQPEAMGLAVILVIGAAVVAFGMIWYAFQRGDQVVPVPLPSPVAVSSLVPPATAPSPVVTVTAPNFDPLAPTAPTVVSTTAPEEPVVVVTTVRNP